MQVHLRMHPTLHSLAQISFFCRDGGKDCFSFSALPLSFMTSVYKNLLQRILNFVSVPFLLILTLRASFRRAICKNWRISVICFGMVSNMKHSVRKGAVGE